jgi:hypothetical protein
MNDTTTGRHMAAGHRCSVTAIMPPANGKSVYKKAVERCRWVSKEEAGKVRRSRMALGVEWR